MINYFIFNKIKNIMVFKPENRNELYDAIKIYTENKEEGIKLYGNINTWNVENVSDMSQLFKNCENFNEDISNWNVENVQYMYAMFQNCYNFNQPFEFLECW